MPVGQGKQVSKEGAYLAMWLTSDTKFNEVILSIFLKRDDMQFWLYKIQSDKNDIFSHLKRVIRGRQVKDEGAYTIRDWGMIRNWAIKNEV